MLGRIKETAPAVIPRHEELSDVFLVFSPFLFTFSLVADRFFVFSFLSLEFFVRRAMVSFFSAAVPPGGVFRCSNRVLSL